MTLECQVNFYFPLDLDKNENKYVFIEVIYLFTFMVSFYRSSGMEGSITMNGNERNLSTFRKLSAYIMQDNQLHGNLTVEEAMKVAASLKLSSKIDKAEKEELVR